MHFCRIGARNFYVQASHQECYISPLENIISSASAFLEFLECTVTASHNNVSNSPAARHGGAGGAEHEGPIHARA